MSSQWYLSGIKAVLNGTTDLTSDTIKVAVLTSSYTADFDAHDFYDDISANEIANSGGYAAGGATLASKTFNIDTTNDRVWFDAADISSWTTVTAADYRYLCVYKSTGTPGTSPLLFLMDLGATQSIAGGTLGVTWSATAGLGGFSA